MILGFPLKGKFLGIQSSKQPNQTSRDLNNVRPFFDGRAVGGQRPGMDKVYSQQIGGGAYPVVAMCSVTVVD
ncbi:hypothetical protein LCGC14_2380570 [marine sediment metagenome]|uniref:Uncharacterized protein n=1 Tax=marine sediment metagenome TaxID=412755 RepID=A0A0F9C119_9ZZZZ